MTTEQTDQLARLVQRALSDRDFVERALADLDATLDAEGFVLSAEELAAVREFHAEVAGASPDEAIARLADTARRQGS